MSGFSTSRVGLGGLKEGGRNKMTKREIVETSLCKCSLVHVCMCFCICLLDPQPLRLDFGPLVFCIFGVFCVDFLVGADVCWWGPASSGGA